MNINSAIASERLGYTFLLGAFLAGAAVPFGNSSHPLLFMISARSPLISASIVHVLMALLSIMIMMCH
jgi:hypothetical protein